MQPFTKALTLLSVACCIVTTSLSADDKKAQAALQAGDYKTAKIEAEASLDTLISNLVMGMLYENGYGVEADLNRAIPYYEKAGELGNFQVLEYLGKLFEDGKKVTTNIQRAIQYYELAGKMGGTKSYIHLATLFTKGEKIALDYVKVRQYLSLAVAQKNGGAAQILGSMAETGLGQTIDFEQALVHYQQAIDLGDHAAILQIMRLHTIGYGNIIGSVEAGNKILWQAASEGNPHAAKKLAQLYASGTERGISKNAEQAYYWYTASNVFGLIDEETTAELKALQAELPNEKMTSIRTDVFKLVAQVNKIKSAKAAEKKRITALKQALADEKAAIATMDTAPVLEQYGIMGYELEWIQRWGVKSSTDAVISTKDGGLFAFGKNWNKANDSWHAAIVRYNIKGEWLWFKAIESKKEISINDVVELDNGDFILAGNVVIDDDANYSMTAWAARVDRTGALIWQKEFDEGNFNTLTKDGDTLFLSGAKSINDPEIFQKFERERTLALVVKINSDGDMLDTWSFGTGISNWLLDSNLASNGNLVLVGSHETAQDVYCDEDFGCSGTFFGRMVNMSTNGNIISDKILRHTAKLSNYDSDGSARLEALAITPLHSLDGSVNDTVIAAGNTHNMLQGWIFASNTEGASIGELFFPSEIKLSGAGRAPDGTTIIIGTGKKETQPHHGTYIGAYRRAPFEERWSLSLHNYRTMISNSMNFGPDGSLIIGGHVTDDKNISNAFVAKLKPIIKTD